MPPAQPSKFAVLILYTSSVAAIFESCYQLVSAWSIALKTPSIRRLEMAGSDWEIHVTRQLYSLLLATNTALNIAFAITNLWLLAASTVSRGIVIWWTTRRFLSAKADDARYPAQTHREGGGRGRGLVL